MQRVYILSQNDKWNVLGIFTNIRQTRKYIATLENADNLTLQEMRLNEPSSAKDATKMLIDPVPKKPLEQQNA